MKRKLLLAALVVAGAVGFKAQAQMSDVTNTYITNAGFETDEAASALNGSQQNTPTGWTISPSSLSNTQWGTANSSTTIQGLATTESPTEGNNYFYFRDNWQNGTNIQVSQNSKTEVPAGNYIVYVDVFTYSSNATQPVYTFTVSEGTTPYVTGNIAANKNAWVTYYFHFKLDAAATLTFSANMTPKAAASSKHDWMLLDNIRLLKANNPQTPVADNTADLYLYNEATAQYLSAGHSWGTHAIVDGTGQPITANLSNGTYTLKTQEFNKYVGGLYMDAGSVNWLFFEAGESGKYYLTQDGYNYMTSNGAGAEVTNVTSPTAASVWTIVSKADRISALSSATKASPTNATFLINDPNFGRNNTEGFNSWTRTSGNADYTGKAGDNENFNWQKWNGAIDFNQTVSDLPNGLYKMQAQGFYRPGANNTNSTTQAAYFYAGNVKQPIALVSSPHKTEADATNGFTTNNTNEGSEYYVPNSQSDASKCFTAGYYENTVDNIPVTDGSMKIGVKNDGTVGNQWVVIDNFRLFYYGPTIGGEAEELPTTAMTANKWYYFDIAVDGDYDFTTTTLNDIVYTTNGNILIEDGNTVTATFANASEVALTAGRYYVKSASAQTFAVNPHSFNYEIGAATLSTADGGYTQAQTFTVTFPSASTNDPDGVAELVASSKATVNGSEVALTAVTNGFSLDLGTLTVNTDYTISIPADVYGYAGESMNEAINLTIHTPVLFDGVYCFYDANTKSFMGRGAAWGTEAVVDKYGIPFNLTTDASGVSAIEFVDWTGVYVFKTDNNSMFTDNASTGWNIISTDGGYKIKTASGDLYAKVDNGDYGYYVHAVEGVANATVWTLKTKAERDAIIAAYPTDNISNVITASGVSTTAAEFETYLSTYYNSVDMTDKIGTATFAGSAGSWTWAAVRGQDGQPAYGDGFAEVWCATGTYTQTIGKANLPAGIYKLTVQGYERRKDNNAATELYNAGYNLVSTYLAANGEQVRFTDWNEVTGKPTNTGGAVTAFNNGAAVNEVYVYLDGNTDLTITVKKPNYIWDCWAIFNNFTLTRYEASATMSITSAQYATFCAPFDVAIPTVVTAYTVDGATGTTLSMTEVETTIPANTPVLLYSESVVNNTFYGKAIADTPTEGLLTGVYEATEAPDDSYVLASINNKVAFYQVDNENKPTVGANRAYLTAPAAGAKSRAFFFEGDDATAIATISALTSGEVEAIYTVGGAKVNSLQKGINIVKMQNGETKKVIVK